jgi:hypothetical protein
MVLIPKRIAILQVYGKKYLITAMAAWSRGIVSACHRGDWSYGSWARVRGGSTYTHIGLTDFSWCMIPKQEKMYQMSTICTEWSKTIPIIHKIFQMAIKYTNIFQSEALKNFPKLGYLY